MHRSSSTLAVTGAEPSLTLGISAPIGIIRSRDFRLDSGRSQSIDAPRARRVRQTTTKGDVMRLLTAIPMLSLFAAGCGSLQPAAPLPEPTIAQAWAKALNDCQVDALVALYHAESLFWPTTSRTLATKPDDVRRYYDAACRTSRAINLKVDIGSERVSVAGDVVLSAGHSTATFTDRQGQTQRVAGRFSFAARRIDGKWLIVEHHSSAMPAAPAQ